MECFRCQQEEASKILLDVRQGAVVGFQLACRLDAIHYRGPVRQLSLEGIREAEEDYRVSTTMGLSLREALGLPPEEERKPMTEESLTPIEVEEEIEIMKAPAATTEKKATKRVYKRREATLKAEATGSHPATLKVGGESVELLLSLKDLLQILKLRA